MKILLKRALIFDSESPYNQLRKDILIEEGTITQIKDELNSNSASVIESSNLCVSPGWLDIGTFNGEPGYEYREDLNSLKEAAASGGYTHLAPFPNTDPVGDTKSQIEYLLHKNGDHVVDIFPIGAVTRNADGKELAELYDIKAGGAIAFSDGASTQLPKNQLTRILLYLKGMHSIFVYPFISRELSMNGQINEGVASTSLGMEGIPMVEEVINAFALKELKEYTGAAVHAHNISNSATILALATRVPDEITKSVPYKNLIFDESDLSDFNVHLKMMPPLRDSTEKKALIEFVRKGDITVINSNHVPVNEEDKDREFGQASFGAIGLETCFKALNTFLPELDLQRIVECLSKGPYKALNLENPAINVTQKAVMTIFDPDIEGVFRVEDIKSKSRNSPFIGQNLKGKIVGIINGNRSHLF